MKVFDRFYVAFTTLALPSYNIHESVFYSFRK